MIRLASPDIREEDIDRLLAVIRSGDLVQGKSVEEFERAICDFSGVPHCAAVASGTAALHLALIALGIGHGDQVLVPAFTFPATANAVERVGASVVLCDVAPGSYVVTPEAIEAAMSSSRSGAIKAIIVVHEFGFPAEVARIAEIARIHGVKLIEDAACAMGTIADGFHPGHYSDVACMSFHPRKAITTGEGGALLSHNAALIEELKRLRNHGIRARENGLDFTEAGLNYRLTNFQAALGIGQVHRFGGELTARKKLASHYRFRLDGTHQIVLPAETPDHSWQSFMIVVEGMSRDLLKAELLEKGVESNLGAQALNCLSYFREKYQTDELSCPEATRLFRRGLVLPLYGKLTVNQVDVICDQVLTALA